MKKLLLFLGIILFFINGFSQIKGIVLDINTKNPIPYANISIKDSNYGITSDSKGEFIINSDSLNFTIILSSIGYEKKNFEVKHSEIKIFLKPKIYDLPEILIKAQEKKKLVINRLNKKGLNHLFACGGFSWIPSKFFEYKSNYTETPYISSLKILVQSEINRAKFNIRLLSANENGEPQEEIFNENIFAYASKHKKFVTVNLANKMIRFPEKGLFVALEWLVIDENLHKYSYTMKGSTEKLEGKSYEPKFSVFPSQNDDFIWIYSGGKWRKSKTFSQNDLAIELTLSN